MSIKEIKKEWKSPCYFVRYQRNTFFLFLRFDFLEGAMQWVSVWRVKYWSKREIKREWGIPCYFVRLLQGIALHCCLFYLKTELMLWVSVRIVKNKYDIYQETLRVTLLFRKPSARYCAPISPILFETSIEMSVYVNTRCAHDNRRENERITLLFRKVSARYLAPSSPILLFQTSSLMSVCTERRK